MAVLFGHLDPFRMPANSEYQYDLYPPKQFIRQDPYDNQTGEAEFEDRGLYLDEYDLHLEVLEIKKVLIIKVKNYSYQTFF